MKTFDRKDIFSWSNAEDAKKYIGKSGYFADNVNDLKECNRSKKVFFLVEIKTNINS